MPVVASSCTPGTGETTLGTGNWGQDAPMWNNDGDTARLINRAGVVVDKCSYGAAGNGTANC